MRKKVTKEEIRHDPIRENLEKFFLLITSKRENLYWAIGIIAVLLLVVYFFTSKKPKESPQAQLAYIQAVTLMANNDTTNSIKLFKVLSNQYRNTAEGKRALYYLGIFYQSKGDTAKARDYLEKFLKNSGVDPFLEILAMVRLGDLYASEGNLGKAYEFYKKAYDTNTYETFKPYLILKMAKVLRFQGKYEEALSLLENYKNEHRSLGGYYSAFKQEENLLKGAIEFKKAGEG